MMNTIIDADTAKLAGLQIDLLQKLRQGQVTLEQIEWFTGLKKDTRSRIMKGECPPPPSELGEKLLNKLFWFSGDLGTVKVPDDYEHTSALYSFRESASWVEIDPYIMDQNFPHPTRILKPGDKFRVRIIQRSTNLKATPDELAAFIALHRGVNVGAQGAAIVLWQKEKKLPEYGLFASLDESGRLWKHPRKGNLVPAIGYHHAQLSFELIEFEKFMEEKSWFLHFSDCS